MVVEEHLLAKLGKVDVEIVRGTEMVVVGVVRVSVWVVVFVFVVVLGYSVTVHLD